MVLMRCDEHINIDGPTAALFSVYNADYATWRSNIEGALRVFLFEKVFRVLEIEEEGELN